MGKFKGGFYIYGGVVNMKTLIYIQKFLKFEKITKKKNYPQLIIASMKFLLDCLKLCVMCL